MLAEHGPAIGLMPPASDIFDQEAIAAAVVALSVKRTMGDYFADVRKYWITNGNSDRMIVRRKGGHL